MSVVFPSPSNRERLKISVPKDHPVEGNLGYHEGNLGYLEDNLGYLEDNVGYLEDNLWFLEGNLGLPVHIDLCYPTPGSKIVI